MPNTFKPLGESIADMLKTPPLNKLSEGDQMLAAGLIAGLTMAYVERERFRDGCKLVAHDTGDGWALMVENEHGETVGYLNWPETWPEVMSSTQLRQCGFEVV